MSVDGTTLGILDDRGEVNVLSVQFNGLGYDVYDDTSRLRAGTGCFSFQGRRHHVSCIPLLAVEKLEIDAGGGADFVLLDAIEVPVEATGGAGDDLIEGGGSADRLEGGAGNDAIIGEAGNDTLGGSDGDDLMQGGSGADRLSGGADADVLEGEIGSGDLLQGGGGPDLLRGGAGDDTLQGGDGEDVLVTGKGEDEINTGAGDDRVFGTPEDTVAVCDSGDQVRTGATRPAGCPSLPGDARVPQAWPPLPDEAASMGIAARAAFAGSDPAVRKNPKVTLRANKRVIALQLKHPQREEVTVRVQLYRDTKTRRRLGRSFLDEVFTRQSDTIVLRGPRTRARSAKVECCFG